MIHAIYIVLIPAALSEALVLLNFADRRDGRRVTLSVRGRSGTHGRSDLTAPATGPYAALETNRSSRTSAIARTLFEPVASLTPVAPPTVRLDLARSSSVFAGSAFVSTRGLGAEPGEPVCAGPRHCCHPTFCVWPACCDRSSLAIGIVMTAPVTASE